MKLSLASLRSALAALRRGAAGSVAVELALAVPILGMLMMVSFDVARGFQTKLRLESAARAGAQYAVAIGATEDEDGVEQAARDDANDPGLQIDRPVYVCMCVQTGDTTPCNSNCGGDVPAMTASVTTNGQYQPMFDYLGLLPPAMPLTGNATIRVR